MRTKRRRGYAEKRNRSHRMYAPCPTGKDVTDQQVADTKYWVGRIRATLGRDAGNEPVTLEMIHAAKEAAKLRAA